MKCAIGVPLAAFRANATMVGVSHVNAGRERNTAIQIGYAL